MSSMLKLRLEHTPTAASPFLLQAVVVTALTQWVLTWPESWGWPWLQVALPWMAVACLLLLAGASLATLVTQALRPSLNRTSLLPGIVLMYGSWVMWSALHNPRVTGFPDSFGLPVVAALALTGLATAAVALVMLLSRRPLRLRAFGYTQLYRADPALIEKHTQQSAKVTLAGDAGEQKDAPKMRYPAIRPRTTFNDLCGNDDLKTALRGAGRSWREDGKNGILLFGPPGTGKTAFAEALAGELGLRFMKVTFGDLASKFINQSTEQLVLAFNEARQQQPVMLFIDEVDSLLKSRDSVGNYEEYERMVTTFLDKVVDARGTQVLVAAATNYINRLDDAAIREGRFDHKIQVPLPDAPARRGLLASRLASLHCEADDETMARLTRRWGGFNVPRLLACAEGAGESARLAAGLPAKPASDEPENPVRVAYEHFYLALRKIQGRKGGAPEGAKQLSEMFLDPEQSERLAGLATQLVDVDRVERMGGSLPKGVLFFGPPGTGKTATAMALARECGWSFISRTGRELLAEGAIDQLGKEASDLRPAIVFIDEGDDILGDRQISPHKSATNELLILIDGAEGMLNDVVWIAATNHPDSMDAAARRGGRFGQKIAFGPPSKQTAMRLIVDWLQRKKADKAVKIAGTAESWAEQMYPVLEGLTPSDLYQVLDAANNAAITDNLRKQTPRAVTIEHIQHAAAELRG
jgi:transitional endoplasmic reticulum ATPase